MKKREAIGEQSLLKLERYFAKQPTWDEAAILARGAELIGRALVPWPR